MELSRAVRLLGRFTRDKNSSDRTPSLDHVCVCVAFCRPASVAPGVDDPAFPDGVRAKLLCEFIRSWNQGNHCSKTRWSEQEPQ